MTIKEIRKADADKLRALCINKGWFDMGTNRDYDRFLFYGLSHQDITTNDLKDMAEMILIHTGSAISEYSITDVMFELNTCCYTYFQQL